MKSIGIIGYGKFANLIITILAHTLPEVNVKIFSRSQIPDGKTFFSFKECALADYVVPAVPISAFAETIEKVSVEIERESFVSTVIDVCSVKKWPKEVMLKSLPTYTNIICTHPNFGPESYRLNSYSTKGMNLIIENVRCDEHVFADVKNYFKSLELNVISMQAEQHDKEIGLPHFISMIFGLTVNRLQLSRTEYGAASTQRMFDMAEGVGKDLAIVKDMYKYNPYCKEYLQKYESASQEIWNEIADLN